MKRILVIGGGQWQIPIIKKIKELGHTVICTNLYENSPAFKFSDHSYIIDILNKNKNLEIAKKHKVHAVISDQTDIAVKTVAYINKKLSLNGNKEDIAELFTNKLRMRNEINIPNIHHPKFKLCKNVQDVINFFEKIQVPIILKPLDNQSSRGLEFVDSLLNIKDKVKTTLMYCHNKQFLAEEFIGGIELTVEGYKSRLAKHESYAVSKKTHFKNTIGVASSLQYQQKFDEFNINILKEINNQIFKNINFGITHTEYKLYKGKFYLVEAAIRGGGTKVSSLITPLMSGYDTNSFLIKEALGENILLEKTVKTENTISLNFFNFKEGVVKEITGIDILKNNENILDYSLEFEIGSYIKSPTDDRSRSGYYIIKANDIEELKKISKEIQKNILISYKGLL
ncbi:hypothetical protein CP965_07310 [Halarcobacter mediterraneus]|uniref:ATP-grasp domain-containing protein n=1 Tax=Halarcobacter mediterraneus TaxID=2023153 RepID=A0A4Q1AXT1_9BACT|nr:ATP-grasp domain-containing protein [Halarcobacter mediterraneus]RXK13598.1 hypothetical protein CP965_07310 [Halarcobacter mediterraneus]